MQESSLKVPENIELLESLRKYIPGCFTDQPTGRQETLMLKKWFQTTSDILNNSSECNTTAFHQTNKDL